MLNKQNVKLDINLSDLATNIINTLHENGYECYVVGGYLRDYFAGFTSKDIDLVTDAKPEQIKSLFGKQCIIIGKRFCLAHIRSGKEIIELSTFRADIDTERDERKHGKDGIILRDNLYGGLQTDINRRDFTCNAIYYDAFNHILLDPHSGIDDVKNKVIRLIGYPELRLREDPVRIWRAIRFASKLGFTLDKKLEAAMANKRDLLRHIPAGRRFDEYIKLLLLGYGEKTFKALHQYQVLDNIFPYIDLHFESGELTTMLNSALINSDNRIVEGKNLNPAFMLSVILWPRYQHYLKAYYVNEVTFHAAEHKAASKAIAQQLHHVTIPKVFVSTIRGIWYMQVDLEQRHPRKIMSILQQPKFRAAYDFFLLRSEVDESLVSLAEWWTKIQTLNQKGCDRLISKLEKNEAVKGV